MKILTLDLGTKTGLAYNYNPAHIPPEEYPGEAVTLVLAKPSEVTEWGRQRFDRRRDPRVMRFYAILTRMRAPDIAVFEDVPFASYAKQVQLWSALRTALWTAFPSTTIFECVPTTTLKKFATGNGAADKRQMYQALCKRPRFSEDMLSRLDDNAIDALWLMEWAKVNLSRLKK